MVAEMQPGAYPPARPGASWRVRPRRATSGASRRPLRPRQNLPIGAHGAVQPPVKCRHVRAVHVHKIICTASVEPTANSGPEGQSGAGPGPPARHVPDLRRWGRSSVQFSVRF